MPMQEALAGMELQPAMDTSHGDTISPENLNLMGWSPGMDQYRPTQEQGIFQFPPALARPEQLNKDGQTIQHLGPSASSLDEAGHSIRQNYGPKSPDQALNTLADVAVAVAPTVTVTNDELLVPENNQDAEMSESAQSASMSRAESTGSLNVLVDHSIGSNLQPSEKSALLKALLTLEDQVNPGKVLDLLKKAHQDLETGDKRPTRSNSNMSLSSSQHESGIQCPTCFKKLPRSCDMKFVFHPSYHSRSYSPLTGNISSAIQSHTAALSLAVIKSSGPRTTGSGTRIRSISSRKCGGAK